MLLAVVASAATDRAGSCAPGPGAGGRERARHGTGTLAYVLSTCRVAALGEAATQELWIRRGDCAPVRVAQFASAVPVVDPVGLCGLVANNRNGQLSPLAGVFQRLGVMADGSGVVFEVSNAFQLISRTDIPEEQQGFFYVRADGTGLRRLGPPSRDPTYRIFYVGGGGAAQGYAAAVDTEIGPSPDGAMIAYTDLGPGTRGAETLQVFTLNLRTGERRQVTRLDPLDPPRPSERRIQEILFTSPHRIMFRARVGEAYESVHVDIDGTKRRDRPTTTHLAGIDGHIERAFRISGRHLALSDLVWSTPAENADVRPGAAAHDMVRVMGRDLIQLTNFHRSDTYVMGYQFGSVMFMASGNPFGTNPGQNCQVFRVSPFGGHLRQLTRFGNDVRSKKGCGNLEPGVGCSIDFVLRGWSTRSQLFYSDCDPFGTNPDGGQVFAIDYDGSNLRQLTHAAGARVGADGTLEVEIAGPTAAGGR